MGGPDHQKVYGYQPNPRWMRLIGLLLVALGLVYAQPFPPFWLFVGAGGLIGGVIGLFAVGWHRMRCPKTIVLTDDAVVIPKSSWSSEVVTVPYTSIASLEREKDPSSAFLGPIEYLHIVFPGGKITIHGKWLPAQRDFEEIEQFIRSKLEASKGTL